MNSPIDPQTIEAEERRKTKAAQTIITGLEQIDPIITDACTRLLATIKTHPIPVEPDYTKQARITALRENWNVPRRQLEFTPPFGRTKWREKLEVLQGRIGTGFTIAILGPPGPGKTQMAVEAMKLATEQLRSAYFTTAMDFFMEIKSTYGRTDNDELAVIKRHCRPSLLVLDEAQELAAIRTPPARAPTTNRNSEMYRGS